MRKKRFVCDCSKEQRIVENLWFEISLKHAENKI